MESPSQKPPAGWGDRPGATMGGAISFTRASPAALSIGPAWPGTSSILQPSSSKPGGLWPPEKHPWPRHGPMEIKAWSSWIPRVPTARVEPWAGHAALMHSAGGPIPTPLGRRQAPIPQPHVLPQSVGCQEEHVERPKSRRLPGKLRRPGPGHAGWQRWAEAEAHLGAISVLPSLAAFPPRGPAAHDYFYTRNYRARRPPRH